MRTVDEMRRTGVAVPPDTTIRTAAELMEQAGVGALVVIDGGSPLGIVTDRDIVRRGVARGLPLDARIDSIMSVPVRTIGADTDVREAFRVFRTHSLRRLPVLRGGKFLGMLTVDDLLLDLTANLADIVQPIASEVSKAQHDSPTPVAM